MSLSTSPGTPGDSATKPAEHQTLWTTVRRGLVLGARFGAIIWCVIVFVIALIYFIAQTYAWAALGRLPDPPPQTLDDWLGLAAGVSISLALVAVYSAIAGAGVTVTAAITRRLRARGKSRTS